MSNIKFIESNGFVKSFTGFVSQNETKCEIVEGGNAMYSDVVYIYVNKDTEAVEYIGETGQMAKTRTFRHWSKFNLYRNHINRKPWADRWSSAMVGVRFDIYVKPAKQIEIVKGHRVSARHAEEQTYIEIFPNRINIKGVKK